MLSHLRDCLAALADVRSVASESSDSGRKHRRLAGIIPRTPGDGAVFGRVDALIPRTYSARQERDFELDLLRVLLFSSIAFSILDAPPFRALRNWMPGIKRIPSRRAMSGPVLQRLIAILTTNAKSVYSKGAYVSLSFDGWKITANRKLLRMITGLVDMYTGKVGVDFRGTRDITALAEKTGLIVGQVELELAKALPDNDYVPPLSSGGRYSACASVLTSVVSDSASCNVGAKLEFLRRFPSIVMVACMAHQLNLLMANIVTHPALKSAAGHCSKVVVFFKQSTKYRGLLEELMTETLGHIMSLVQSGETRWYSHHGVLQRLLKLKPALVAFSDRYHSDRALRSTANGATVSY